MQWLIAALAGLTASGLAWLSLQAGLRAYRAYRQSFREQADGHLEQFFLFVDVRQLWFAAATGACSLSLAGFLVSGSPWVALLLFALMPFVPFSLARRLRQRRMAMFERQLPGFLLSLAGALRAGAGLQGALQSIASQSAAPLGQEFSMLLREQRMGVPLETALGNLQQRMPVEGMLLLGSLLNVAAGSGGNLAGTLENVAQTLRERLHLQGRIRALTAQGRLQAWIMACLPVALGIALALLNPAAMAPLWQTPAGWAVLAAMAMLETVGIIMIRRIVAITV